MKVLYVEDEKYLALAVAKVLKRNNYSIDLAYDGEAGLDLALSGMYDIIILDVMLPKIDGVTILRRLRECALATPVLMLSAKGETHDKVAGLDNGADDYLAKPFAMEELLARLRALGRRQEQLRPENVICFEDIRFNYNTLDLIGNGQTFHLTLKESQLLELLLNNQGRVIENNTIIEKLWGWDSDAQNSHVQVQVAFLRKKLGLISTGVKIKTVYGAGYMLAGNGTE